VSINDVSLFGTLVEDVVPRKNRAGQPFATFHVKTYKFVRDRLTGQPREDSVVHEVHCYDEASIAPLGAHGKAGAWVRIRGEVAYKDNRAMFVRVPMRGGMAIVSAYFGTDITPSHPYRPTVGSEHIAAPQEEPSTTAVSDQNDGTPPATSVAATASEADRGLGIETSRAVSSEVEPPKEPDAAAASALDELHADAVRPEPREIEATNLLDAAAQVQQPTPTALPAARPSLPSLRRPTAPAVAATSQAQPAAPAPAPNATTPPPHPSAPPPATKPTFPNRPPGGMPRPVAPAPAPSTAGSTTLASSPAKSSFGRLPTSTPQATRSVSTSSSRPSGSVLTADDIPF
jgi:hypothetical protein